jgi:hypothetical protein
MSCPHEDVRYSADEKGAIACYACGRLFGHLIDGWVHPHNVIRIDESVLRLAREDPGAYGRARSIDLRPTAGSQENE